MITCKQLEESSIDYICNLLNDEQVAVIEEHLRVCPDCAGKIASWENVSSLTEIAGEVTIPGLILDNIEMKVYKRLAAESPSLEQKHFLSRFVPSFALQWGRSLVRPMRHGGGHSLARRGSRRGAPRFYWGSTWVWRGAVATGIVAVGILVATTFFDIEQSPDVPLSSIPVQSSVERLEQYRQQEIQRSFEDAVEARHLKEDDWAATSKLRLLREQAEGTPWATMANNQLQITNSASKEGI